MPSEKPNEPNVFETLSRPLGAFRSALAATIERLRDMATDAQGDATDPRGGGAADLGAFALGRIRGDLFEAVARRERAVVEPGAMAIVEQAFRVLTDLLERGDAAFRVEVPSGASLHHVVEARLGEVGRAFAAARAAELARAGRPDAAGATDLARPFPFLRWNRGERRIAPPLVVDVDGGDLLADCLAGYLDGEMKLVLLVRGACPVAPLARLVTPGTYVAQVTSLAGLAGLGAWKGPGVAAVVPEGAARFVHDPAVEGGASNALGAVHLPETAPARPVGAWSVFQQAETMRHLSRLLEAQTAATPASGASGPPADPAGRLAAWLLQQAGPVSGS